MLKAHLDRDDDNIADLLNVRLVLGRRRQDVS